jgi:hypothetical protein
MITSTSSNSACVDRVRGAAGGQSDHSNFVRKELTEICAIGRINYASHRTAACYYLRYLQQRSPAVY